MRFLILAALVLCSGAILVLGFPQDKYTTKYDNVNLDDIMKNDRLLKGYVNCLLEKGSCTPDGAELKEHLPDAIHSECSKCSEKQKEGSKKIIKYLIKNKADWWKELEEKYDKEGTYKKRIEKEFA